MQSINIKNIHKTLWISSFKKIVVVLFTSVGLSTGAYSAPIISPLLADLSSDSYSSSMHYLTSTAESAFNGGVWNAGTTGSHWIQANIGSVESITELRIITAQAPNGVTQHKVFKSNSNIGNGYGSLTPIYEREGNTTHGTVLNILFDTPQIGQFFLILVNNGPTSWTAIGDIEPRSDWEQRVLNVSVVPLPPAVFIFSTAMLGIGLLARRRKKSSSTSLN